MKKRIFNPYKWKRKIKRGSQNSLEIIDIESRLNIRPTLGTNRWKREVQHDGISLVQKRTFHKIFLFITLFAITGICFFHPFFSLRTFEIQGLERTPEKNVYISLQKYFDQKNWFFLSFSNYYAFNENNLITMLQQEYPFESISLKKKFPHSLNIVVHEKPGAFVFDDGKNYILIGKTGERLETLRSLLETEWNTITTPVSTLTTSTTSTTEIFPQIKETRVHTPDFTLTKIASKSYPLVYDPKGRMDQKTFSKEVVEGILEWNEFLWKKQNIAITYIELLENSTEGYVRTSAGWGIYVSFLNTDQALPLFQDIFTKIDKGVLEYIDFRYLQRIYWK